MPNTLTNATGGATAGRDERTRDSALLDVGGVAALLGCSSRHVYRLSDAGRMPRPCKLMSLTRWNRAAIMDWINSGCPEVRRAGR